MLVVNKDYELKKTIFGRKYLSNVVTGDVIDINDTTEDIIKKLESNSMEMEVANRSEIKTGKAEIMCELENGKTQNYEIEIQKIFTENNQDNKSMLIKVTDEDLIEKTGGIIQGMSGAPIIQNGKFIGAVTHVLVSDPTQGYAVFADIMIKQMKEVD